MTEVISQLSPELLLAAQTELGECPVWDGTRGCFFFMDIIEKKLHRLDWSTKLLTSLKLPALGGGLVLAKDGRLIACLQNGIHWLDPESGDLELIVDPEQDKPEQRLNEAKADPEGRLWVGSISTLGRFPVGCLYRMNRDRSVTPVLTEIAVPNTLVWLPGGSDVLFSDSAMKVIWRFRYDGVSGSLSDRTVFVDCADYRGIPDGAAVDAEGCIWIAEFGGGVVRRYDGQGNVIARIELPATQVTSCAFAGPSLQDLVIITTKRLLDENQRLAQPHAGDLFVVRPGVPGVEPHRFG